MLTESFSISLYVSPAVARRLASRPFKLYNGCETAGLLQKQALEY